jgi:Zn finger protein HypA/HybF involved in hydrogenase expression
MPKGGQVNIRYSKKCQECGVLVEKPKLFTLCHRCRIVVQGIIKDDSFFVCGKPAKKKREFYVRKKA